MNKFIIQFKAYAQTDTSLCDNEIEISKALESASVQTEALVSDSVHSSSQTESTNEQVQNTVHAYAQTDTSLCDNEIEISKALESASVQTEALVSDSVHSSSQTESTNEQVQNTVHACIQTETSLGDYEIEISKALESASVQTEALVSDSVHSSSQAESTNEQVQNTVHACIQTETSLCDYEIEISKALESASVQTEALVSDSVHSSSQTESTNEQVQNTVHAYAQTDTSLCDNEIEISKALESASVQTEALVSDSVLSCSETVSPIEEAENVVHAYAQTENTVAQQENKVSRTFNHASIQTSLQNQNIVHSSIQTNCQILDIVTSSIQTEPQVQDVIHACIQTEDQLENIDKFLSTRRYVISNFDNITECTHSLSVVDNFTQTDIKEGFAGDRVCCESFVQTESSLSAVSVSVLPSTVDSQCPIKHTSTQTNHKALGQCSRLSRSIVTNTNFPPVLVQNVFSQTGVPARLTESVDMEIPVESNKLTGSCVSEPDEPDMHENKDCCCQAGTSIYDLTNQLCQTELSTLNLENFESKKEERRDVLTQTCTVTQISVGCSTTESVPLNRHANNFTSEQCDTASQANGDNRPDMLCTSINASDQVALNSLSSGCCSCSSCVSAIDTALADDRSKEVLDCSTQTDALSSLPSFPKADEFLNHLSNEDRAKLKAYKQTVKVLRNKLKETEKKLSVQAQAYHALQLKLEQLKRIESNEFAISRNVEKPDESARFMQELSGWKETCQQRDTLIQALQVCCFVTRLFFVVKLL